VRFHLVDRIAEAEPRRRLVARKCVSLLDPVLDVSACAGPSLAHTVAVECLAQASAWLILLTTDFAQRGILGGFRRITFGRPAPVGSHLDLVTEVEDWTEEGVMFDCVAACDGETVVQVEGALCLLIEAGTLEDPEQTRRHYELLRRDDHAEAPPAGLPVGTPFAGSRAGEWVPYDVVEECVAGQHASARKAISMTDPVFDAHFARFPIVPGVLLLESILALGRTVAAEGGSQGSPWRAGLLQGIRYRRYVRPGDLLRVKVQVTEQAEGEARLSGRAEVGGEAAVTIRRIGVSAS
jgi:3-hydroxyacyl-[acyl-carrier-protein] dehydratase